jgi:peptidoglycan/LPS O-acetylase OafA/YrhL
MFRGLAAVAVVGFHTNIILKQPEYGGQDIFGWLSSLGWLGVNFFFILSGFIIFFAHSKDIGRPEQLPNYLWRRFSRVYPAYWILLTLFIAAAAAGLGHPDFSWETGHFVTAYSLVQTVDMPTLPLKVAWTLLFEVKFYLLFAILLISRRWGMILMVGWALAILLRNCFQPLPDWGNLLPDFGLLNIWNIYFVIGMVTAWLYRRLPDGYATLLVAAGSALLLGLSYNLPDMKATTLDPLLMILLGLGLAMFLLGVALAERRYAYRIPSWMLSLGNASYSIYLIHSAVISMFAGIYYRRLFDTLPDYAAYLIAFSASIAAGTVFHLLAERPMLQWARSGFELRGQFFGLGKGKRRTEVSVR